MGWFRNKAKARQNQATGLRCALCSADIGDMNRCVPWLGKERIEAPDIISIVHGTFLCQPCATEQMVEQITGPAQAAGRPLTAEETALIDELRRAWNSKALLQVAQRHRIPHGSC